MLAEREPVEQIVAQAKQLSPEQRLRLIQRITETLLPAISSPSHEQRTQEFEAEIANFERLKAQLLQQYPNKFVAIYQGEMVAVGDDKMNVLATVQGKFGNVPCYITKVTEDGPRRVHMLSPRIVR